MKLKDRIRGYLPVVVDVETGDVIEFYHAELEALKEQVAREMGYELVDHRLELFGRKLK